MRTDASTKAKALLSAGQTAEMIGVHQTTVVRWAHKGIVPVVGKLPGETGSYVFDRDAVQEFLDKRAAAQETEAERAAS
ncbi:helix-turn-helix domain-containing protein [Nocardia neocaledoniensis]|uniref:helix-turn-helix domain-containing protein n=1 Tax=Nocardia neocaledoniensis TaxID=236511 RepID=UPI0024546D1F|nr:helix-turn-helix domain-containing protein [Nocardia neocaledoniensis]